MAVLGADAKISVNDGASNAQQDFPEVLKITVPSAEVAKLPNAYLGMGSAVIPQGPGLHTPGDVAVECRYAGAVLTRLEALKGVVKTYIVTSPDENGATAGGTKTATFSGFVTKYEWTAEPEAYSNITFTIAQATGVTVA